MTPCAIFLCDKTGIAARPWADAGIECWCVDIDHSIRRERKRGNINFVWGDVRTWRPPPRAADTLRRGIPTLHSRRWQRRARLHPEARHDVA